MDRERHLVRGGRFASIFVTDANAIFEPINPGNSLTRGLIFDVPVGSSVTALELHDSLLSRGAKVTVTR